MDDDDSFFFAEGESDSEEHQAPQLEDPTKPDPTGRCWINTLPADLFALISFRLPMTQVGICLKYRICQDWKKKITFRLGHLPAGASSTTHMKFGRKTGLLYSLVGLTLLIWDPEQSRVLHSIPINHQNAQPSSSMTLKLSKQENLLLIHDRTAPFCLGIRLPLESSGRPQLVPVKNLSRYYSDFVLSPDATKLGLVGSSNHEPIILESPLGILCSPTRHTPSLGTVHQFGFLHDPYSFYFLNMGRKTPFRLTILKHWSTLTCEIDFDEKEYEFKKAKVSKDQKTILVCGGDKFYILKQTAPGVFQIQKRISLQGYFPSSVCFSSDLCCVLIATHSLHDTSFKINLDAEDPALERVAVVHSCFLIDGPRTFNRVRAPGALIIQEGTNPSPPQLCLAFAMRHPSKQIAWMNRDYSITLKDLKTGTRHDFGSSILGAKYIFSLDDSHVGIMCTSPDDVLICALDSFGTRMLRRIALDEGYTATAPQPYVRGEFIVLRPEVTAHSHRRGETPSPHPVLEFNWKSGLQTRRWDNSSDFIPVYDPKGIFPVPIVMYNLQCVLPDGRKFSRSFDNSYALPTLEVFDKDTIQEMYLEASHRLIHLNTPDQHTVFNHHQRSKFQLLGTCTHELSYYIKTSDVYETHFIMKREPTGLMIATHLAFVDAKKADFVLHIFDETYLKKIDLVSGIEVYYVKGLFSGIQSVFELSDAMLLALSAKKMYYFSRSRPGLNPLPCTAWSDPQVNVVDGGKRVVIYDKGIVYQLGVAPGKVWVKSRIELFPIPEKRTQERTTYLPCGEYLLVHLDGVLAVYHWRTESTFYRFLENST